MHGTNLAIAGASGSVFASEVLRALEVNRGGHEPASGFIHLSPGNRAKSLSVV